MGVGKVLLSVGVLRVNFVLCFNIFFILIGDVSL